MVPNIKRAIYAEPAYKPLLSLLEGMYMTAGQLAVRWNYSEDHLSNLRRDGKGVPWIKLPTGAIRYKVEDVVAAELRAAAGPLSLSAVCLAVAACESVPKEHRAAIVEHLRENLKGA